MNKYINEVEKHILNMCDNEVKNNDNKFISNKEILNIIKLYILNDFKEGKINDKCVIYCFEYLEKKYNYENKQHSTI